MDLSLHDCLSTKNNNDVIYELKYMYYGSYKFAITTLLISTINTDYPLRETQKSSDFFASDLNSKDMRFFLIW